MATDDNSIGVNSRDGGAPPIDDQGEAEPDELGESLSDDKTIDLGGPVQIDGDAEAFNLVPQMTEEYLEDAADVVMSSFKTMWDSTEDYREKRRHLYKLFRGNLDPKSEPFEDCANIHLPVVLQAIAALVPRVVTELFPLDDYLYRALPTGPEDQERADILTKHGDWQFRHEMTDFLPQFERVVTECLLIGTAYVYSCYDITLKRNCHEFINCEELVMSYTEKAVAPDLSDVTEKIFIRKYPRHKLEALVASGAFDAQAVKELLDLDDGEADKKQIRGSQNKQNEPEYTVREEVEDVEGHKRPEDDPTAPYVFYEYHGWYVLPAETRQRPVVITVDTTNRKVVSFYVREDDDWRDRERYDREIQAIANYQQAVEQYSQMVRNPQLVPDPMTGAPVPAPTPPLPQPGPDVKLGPDGKPVPPAEPKKVPIEYFTRFDCIYDPHGSLAIGVGDMIMGFNMTANQIGNLFFDSAAVENSPPVLMAQGALPPGDIQIGPGFVGRSQLPPEQIKNASTTIFTGHANPQLIEGMNMMVAAGKEVAATPDVYSGEAGKSAETYRGLATRVEQATKPLTAIAQRILRGLTELVRKNARLNSVFLPDVDIMSVIDPSKGGSGEPLTVHRSIYIEDYDITFTADTRFVSQQQKMDEDMQLMQFATASPLFAGNPFQQKQFLYEVSVRYLKDMKRTELIPYLGPRPVPPPPPAPIAPHEENAMFLQGKAPEVNPGDDDATHLQDHQAFNGSTEGAYLDPQGKKNLEQHVRNHVGAMIMKAAKGVPSGQPGNGGGPPGMAPSPGNPAGPPQN